MLVDFFIIGAPKCGTTAMASYLRDHEQICFSVPKEPHFFCSNIREQCSRAGSVAAYHNHYFHHYDSGLHKVVGEGTPQYLYYPESIPNLLEYNPNAKFVVMLRNPVDMMMSWHREMLRGLIEVEGDICYAWELQESRKVGNNLPDHCRLPLHLQYRDICKTGGQVERLLMQVDRQNVLFLLLEDLGNIEQTYRNVCRFVGVPDDGRENFKKVHTAQVWRSEQLMTSYNALYSLKNKVLGGKPLPFSLDSKIKYMLGLLKAPKKGGGNNEFISLLHQEFEDDIHKLSNLIERDLSAWTADT